MAASALSMRSALAGALVVSKPAARQVQAKAGAKVFARMTKDRVNLKKDSKWRGGSGIDIYPVRAFSATTGNSRSRRNPATVVSGG
jgi:hypothetical protein